MRRLLAIAVCSLSILSAVAAPSPQQPWWQKVWSSPAPVRGAPAVPKHTPKEELAPAPKTMPKVAVALPNYDEETATRLQIFLDNNDFGPGKIDGKMGEFFRKALISFKHARAQRETGVIDQWMLDQVPQTFTTYMIKGDDLAYVGN